MGMKKKRQIDVSRGKLGTDASPMGSNTILWNIQGLKFVLSGISWDKVKK